MNSLLSRFRRGAWLLQLVVLLLAAVHPAFAQVIVFTDPTPPGSSFGSAVAAVGTDKVLIGAYLDNRAYLFSTNGTLLTTFNNPTPAGGDRFGYAVAAVGADKVLIGAYSDDTGATDAGAAYLFSTTGTLLTTFVNPTPANGDNFGSAVAAVGTDKVLIGAYLSRYNAAPDVGAAYVFSINGTLLTTFINPTPAASDYFGSAVAAVGADKVLIGASGDDTGATTDAGAAHLFSTNGTLLTTFTNPTPANGDSFGSAVAAVGTDKVLIGAYSDDTRADNAGAAYLFSIDGTHLATFTSFFPAADEHFGFGVAAVGTDKVLFGAVGAAYLIPVPIVTTLPASTISWTNATLNASVNPNGSATTAWFEWGATRSYGNTTAATNLADNSSATPITAAITGLVPKAGYHFRVAASNSVGRAYGVDQTLFAGASLIIISLTETGGDNEATDTVTAKRTDNTYVGGVANEPVPGLAAGASYTVGRFGRHAPAFVDRSDHHTNAAPAVFPPYLVGGEYIMPGQDNRDNLTYQLQVTLRTFAQVYLLVDNRLGDGLPGTPPVFGPTHMSWVINDGWAPVMTGNNRSGNLNTPDETGIDEGSDGTIDQYYSVYRKRFAAVGPSGDTFLLRQADNAGGNMYVVVVQPATLPNVAQLGGNRIGSVADNGGGSYTIVGGGNDIWDQADEFTYAYQEIVGDFDVQVRVESLTPNARWSKAGLMVRESLSEYSRMAFVRVTPEDVPTTSGGNGRNDVLFGYRTGIPGAGLSGGQHEDEDWQGFSPTRNPNYPNAWLRLLRIGNVIYSVNSLDGVTWNIVSSQDTATWNGGAFGPSVLLGLAVSRHSGGPTATAEFRDYLLHYDLPRGHPVGVGEPVPIPIPDAFIFRVIGASSRGNPTGVQVYFNRPPGAGAWVAANYTLNNGATVIAAAAGVNPNIIQLTTSALTEGTTYTVGVAPLGVFDTLGGALVTSNANFVHGAGYEAHRIRVNHSHTDNGGLYRSSQAVARGLGELTPLGGGTFPGLQLNTVFEDSIPDSGNNEQFSSRIGGVLNITVTGDYTFYMNSDGAGFLYLSPDDNPANKVEIAREPVGNGRREYIAGVNQASRGSPPANISAPQALVAGRKYHLELVYTEEGGGNNGSAAWRPPGGAAVVNGSSPIPESAFAPSRQLDGNTFYALGPVTIAQNPTNSFVVSPNAATFKVQADGTPGYTYQWQRKAPGAGSFSAIPGATGRTYTQAATDLATDNTAQYRVVVGNEFSSATSSIAVLTVYPPGPPAVADLVAEGTAWRYLANGSDQGTAWRSNGFNHTSWPSGPARLGFGGDGEATAIGNATNGIVTYYFRKTFTVTNAMDMANLFGQVQADDGVILYLNGTEIYRRNMTNSAAALNHRSLASAAVEGAEETTFWTFLTNASALVNGVNVLAAEVHQSSTNNSDLGWNLDLVGNYDGVLPPVITIASPTNTVPYNAAGIPLLANARDPEGSVTNVDFFVDGLHAGRVATAPFSGLWTNVTPGHHEVFAQARDNTGLVTLSPVAAFIVGPLIVTSPPPLVAEGAAWKYLANGSDQGTPWRNPGFPDSSWSNGVARLGFGGEGEATVIGDRTNGITTFYFRKSFTVTNAASITNLFGQVQVDDGVILYLNGTEIYRRNMTEGTGMPLSYHSLASATVDGAAETTFWTFLSDSDALVNGVNVLAAEVHQAATNSSDLAWNLELRGNYSGPLVTIASPTNAVPYNAAGLPLLVDLRAPEGTVTNVDFYVDYVYAGSATNPPFSGVWTNATLGNHEVFAWARDNAGFTAFSPVTGFTVLVPALLTTLVNSNAMWKYLDDGSDQGTAWHTNGFNDTGWSNGVAELGYGDSDEVTTVRGNRLDSTRIITTYFRKTFGVGNPAYYSNLVVRLKRDDGGIVYLNGVEILRSNMTNGPGVPVLYTNFAAFATDEVSFFSTNASASLLRASENVLAVEIHQSDLFSSDISFNLQLQGESGPVLSISRSGSVVTLSWVPDVPGLLLQFAPTVTGPWVVSPYQANPQSFTVPGNPPVFLAFWRLLVP